MRPVSLYIEGFAAFREQTTLDFDGLDFFALIGPTGAGKSSVIDAMCFALYGSVPRYDDDRVVGKAVSLGKTHAKVSLTFDVGEGRYRATRVVRVRNGKASTPEALLERVDADGTAELLAGRASEMRAAVEQLLGLPFAHFTKCVVLPQGEFARFLHDEPAKRQELLARLLDLEVYKRVGQRARSIADEAAHAVKLHEAQLDECSFATEDAAAAAQTRVGGLTQLLDEVDRAMPPDHADAETIRTAEERAARVRALRRHCAAVHVPEAVTSLAADAEAARDDLAKAEHAARQAQSDVDELQQRAGALPDRQRLVRAVDAHAAKPELEGALAAAERAVAEAADALHRSTEALSHADAQHEQAQAELDEQRAAHAAHTLAAALVVGEPCPVCEQPVGKRPRRRALRALDAVESRLAEARTLVDHARRIERHATREHERAKARVQAARANVVAVDEIIAEHPDIDAIRAMLAEVETVNDALEAGRKADAHARQDEQSVRKHCSQLEQRLGTLRADVHAQRDPLVELGPPPIGDDLAAGWESLARWASEQRPELDTQATAEDERAATAHAARRARLEQLLGVASAHGVSAGHDLPGLRDAVVGAIADARIEAARIADAIARAAKLREQIDAAAEERDVAALLALQLRADHFERWLVGEALDRLVEGASRTLYDLSNGAYSLTCEDGGEFAVIDHRNADEPRSVRTLSGGETFQAALALALALADELSALATTGEARLDAIFLDEGFGTLDAETLESVAGTIEALGSSGRMVGVVTHVPGLADRVPVRFRVSSGPRGASVVREEL
jgi:exonuclease SbcC